MLRISNKANEFLLYTKQAYYLIAIRIIKMQGKYSVKEFVFYESRFTERTSIQLFFSLLIHVSVLLCFYCNSSFV